MTCDLINLVQLAGMLLYTPYQYSGMDCGLSYKLLPVLEITPNAYYKLALMTSLHIGILIVTSTTFYYLKIVEH